jgi:hypothetical protein
VAHFFPESWRITLNLSGSGLVDKTSGVRSGPSGSGWWARFAPFWWVCAAVAAAVLYGIMNDRITVTLSPEYFSVFKRWQFGPLLEATGLDQAPTRVQAILIGASATWWFGLLLGIMVSLTGTLGRLPRLESRDLLKSVSLVIGLTLGTSLAFGFTVYIQAPRWVTARRHSFEQE